MLTEYQDETHVHTPEQLQAAQAIIRDAHERAYRSYREATKPYRRAFGGERRTFYAMARSARAAWDRDATTVREAVILGARTVADVSQRTGLRRARVARIVRDEGIKAVTR